MRTTLTIFAMIAANGAQAHPGHIADVAGHDHWVAGAAVGIAVLVGIWGAIKGRRTDDAEVEAEDDTEEEAAA